MIENFLLIFILIIVSVASGILSWISKTDSRKRILSLLPGIDCKACGFQTCEEYCDHLAGKIKKKRLCHPIINTDVYEIFKNEFQFTFVPEEPKKARVLCGARSEECNYLADPHRFTDCHSINLGFSHIRGCSSACLMMGSCARICPNNAINMSNSLPEIDDSKCTGCGLCVKECPVDVLTLKDPSCAYFVACSNHEKGSVVHQYCSTGCLGCDVCSKICPVNAITRFENLVSINTEKCVNCGLCALKCPTDSIKIFEKEEKFVIIEEEKCNGCGICISKCPVSAITGEKTKTHVIIENKCIGCGICIDPCPKNAIVVKIIE